MPLVKLQLHKQAWILRIIIRMATKVTTVAAVIAIIAMIIIVI